MTSHARFAEIAALAGDPARAAMLHALLDGRALTAKELADCAGVTPQTASGHLSRLAEADLIKTEKQGRHRYNRLASPAVARMMESIMQVAALRGDGAKPVRVGPRDEALREARTCYDHLAGRLGVAVADAMAAQGYLHMDDDAALLTVAGEAFCVRLGIDLQGHADGRTRSRRLLCRPCLDWSERRSHLAGRLGAAICQRAFDDHWVRRLDGTRALSITPKGRGVLRDAFGVDLSCQ